MGKRKDEAIAKNEAIAKKIKQKTGDAILESNRLTSGETYNNMHETGVIDYHKQEFDRLSKEILDSVNSGSLAHAESLYPRIEKLLRMIRDAPANDQYSQAEAKKEATLKAMMEEYEAKQ